MIGRKQETQPQPEQQYTKEEYAAMKQAEREDTWARVMPDKTVKIGITPGYGAWTTKPSLPDYTTSYTMNKRPMRQAAALTLIAHEGLR